MFKKILATLTALVLVLTSCAALAESAAAPAGEATVALGNLTFPEAGNVTIHRDNGQITFIGGPLTAEPIHNSDDALELLGLILPDIGGDQAASFELWRVIQDPAGNVYYVFQQVQNGCLVLGGSAKVITDADSNMLGLTCCVVPAEYIAEVPEGDGISAKQAESIVIDRAVADGNPVALIEGHTMKVVQPVSREVDINADEIESRYVWAVYTTNPSSSSGGLDLPYLAHYVTLAGEYVYSLPTILPGDAAGAAGSYASYVFEFMEPVPYTGYVDYADGTEHEISVDLMRDTRTGMYYLGNIEHKVIVADCWNFLYNKGQVVLEYSPDNLEWDQTSLLSLYQYCKVWDFFSEIGWYGGDGMSTPVIILKDFCDENHNPVDNAAYAGHIYGYEAFLSSSVNNLAQCLDVCAHEFTHCVTSTVMTYNSYMNDYGAINEGISDILGNICEMMMAPTGDTAWAIGESAETIRSMSDPHKHQQPGHVWDIYYRAQVKDPTDTNDRGGVHTNSSLLNRVAYLLCAEGGMTLAEARAFWFAVDCAMVPATDYAQLRVLLPWVLHISGLDTYQDVLERAMAETRLGESLLPETVDADRALLELNLPDNEVFNNGKWILQVVSLNVDKLAGILAQIQSDFLSDNLEGYPAFIRNVFATAPAEKEKEEDGNILEMLFSLLGGEEAEKTPEQLAAEEAAAQKEADELLELQEWAKSRLQGTLYSDMGTAGPDGHVIRSMSMPGRTLPILLYASLDPGGAKIELLKFVLYLNGRWYDVTANVPEFSESGEFDFGVLLDALVNGAFSREFFGLLQQGADLSALAGALSIDVAGGSTVQIPSEGLEEVTLENGIRNQQIPSADEPNNRKSRPKLSDH